MRINHMHMLSMANGFYQSHILFALLKLHVFEFIGEGTKNLDELARELNAKPEILLRLLKAGVILKLLISNDGHSFRVSPEYRDVLLPSAGENYLGNFIRNLDYVSFAMSKLDQAVLSSGPTIDPASLLGESKDYTSEFIMAMHNYASLHGKEFADTLDTSNCSTLLDLGCGPGTYAFYVGMQNPDLQLFLLDLPETLNVSREVQKKYSLKNKIHYLPMDAVKDDIPGSYDMVLVSNMLHMLGEKMSMGLINRLYDHVNNGGSLVIQAQFIREDRPLDQWPIFMDLVQLCCTDEGRNHSIKETRQWMQGAGFINIDFNPMSDFNINSFLRGYKPE